MVGASVDLYRDSPAGLNGSEIRPMSVFCKMLISAANTSAILESQTEFLKLAEAGCNLCASNGNGRRDVHDSTAHGPSARRSRTALSGFFFFFFF